MKTLNFRSVVFLLIFCLSPLLSYADGLVVSFNDEDGVYGLGDKVIAYVVADQDMELTCELLEYGTVSVRKDTISLRKGRKTVLHRRNCAPCNESAESLWFLRQMRCAY